MKRLALLLIPLLSSCAVIEAFNTPRFSANEYQHIVDIRTMARTGATFCKDATKAFALATSVSDKTQMFMMYEEHLYANTDATKAAKSLDEIAQGLTKRYASPPVPEVFCRIKFEGIENAANVVQHVIGNRPR